MNFNYSTMLDREIHHNISINQINKKITRTPDPAYKFPRTQSNRVPRDLPRQTSLIHEGPIPKATAPKGSTLCKCLLQKAVWSHVQSRLPCHKRNRHNTRLKISHCNFIHDLCLYSKPKNFMGQRTDPWGTPVRWTLMGRTTQLNPVLKVMLKFIPVNKKGILRRCNKNQCNKITTVS